MINSQDIKKGTCIRMDGGIWVCIDFQHRKPGKGNTVMNTKLKNVTDGRVLDRTFQVGFKLEDVRIELQADFLAGVWANRDNAMFNSLEDGDIEEGMNTASKIGDDYLQKKAQGYSVPDSFNHGTSAQRVKWLKKGLDSGDINDGDTFSPEYYEL